LSRPEKAIADRDPERGKENLKDKKSFSWKDRVCAGREKEAT